MRTDFDAIVVGAGATGTAAARSLTERGRSVLLVERFAVDHERGSSGGPTRIFRLSYHHPDYVKMARLALNEWRELEAKAGEDLLITTGGIDVGPGGRETARAVEAAGERLEYLPARAIRERWPALRLDPDEEVFVQEDAGVCMAARAVLAQARLAAANGATILQDTVVKRIAPNGQGVDVVAAGHAYRAPVAVIAAGPWAGPLLREAGVSIGLVPSLEQVTYLALDEPSPLPTVIDWTEDPVRTPYVVPNPERPGHFKVALHHSGPAVDPDTRSFEPDPIRVAKVEDYARRHFAAHSPAGGTETCLYTNAPDEDFVLDRVGPLVIASPCSGHGFKFAPLIGRIVADLATGQPPPVPMERFRASRAVLVRERYPPTA
jgi:sarcosine oxidase